ncbi:MAG: sigma-54-dependent Fis family transcriptional regulator [bacterium]
MNDVLLATLGELVRKEVSAELLLSRIIDAMAKALGADRATVFWVDKAAGELISVAGHFPEVAQIRVPLGEGVAGYVARTGATVNVPFSQEHVDIWRSVDNTTGYQTRTMLAGPLLDGDDVIGVVQFLNKTGGFFSAEDEFSMTQLAAQAALLLKETTLQRQTATEPDLALGEHFNRIVGSGETMRQLFRAVRRVAPTQASVLLQGESGTGKTLLARAVHHNSRRAQQPFVVVDCTTLPDALIENELFGHEKGAFTGADRRVTGKVAAAEKGTLFFDEVGDLPLALQGKLLTLLQNRTYSPVGSTKTHEADIRVIAATHRKLEELVTNGQFREDLYWRLKVVVLEMPPLREREDLDALTDHFVRTMSKRHGRSVSGLTPQARDALRHHTWPGNVRELEHMIESAVIFCEDELIGTEDLRFGQSGQSAARSNAFADQPTMDELERRYITYLLRQNAGNRTECAKIMGIGRTTLIRKIAAYGLDE